MRYTNVLLILAALAFLSSCAPKRIAMRDNREIIETARYSYTQDEKGRWYVLTSTPQALKEAVTKIKPGPHSVDRIDVWVITPLEKPSHPTVGGAALASSPASNPSTR